jgi:hypothetical protein
LKWVEILLEVAPYGLSQGRFTLWQK